MVYLEVSIAPPELLLLAKILPIPKVVVWITTPKQRYFI